MRPGSSNLRHAPARHDSTGTSAEEAASAAPPSSAALKSTWVSETRMANRTYLFACGPAARVASAVLALVASPPGARAPLLVLRGGGTTGARAVGRSGGGSDNRSGGPAGRSDERLGGRAGGRTFGRSAGLAIGNTFALRFVHVYARALDCGGPSGTRVTPHTNLGCLGGSLKNISNLSRPWPALVFDQPEFHPKAGFQGSDSNDAPRLWHRLWPRSRVLEIPTRSDGWGRNLDKPAPRPEPEPRNINSTTRASSVIFKPKVRPRKLALGDLHNRHPIQIRFIYTMGHSQNTSSRHTHTHEEKQKNKNTLPFLCDRAWSEMSPFQARGAKPCVQGPASCSARGASVRHMLLFARPEHGSFFRSKPIEPFQCHRHCRALSNLCLNASAKQRTSVEFVSI